MINLNKLFPRLSIRNKLAIGFMAVALLPLAVVTAVGVRDTIRIIHRAAGSTLARDLELAEAETARALGAAQGHIEFFARVVLADAFGDAAPTAQRLAAAGKEISRQIAVEPSLWRVRVFGPDGEPLLAVDGRGVLATDASGATEAAPYYAWRVQDVPAGNSVIMPVEVRAADAGGTMAAVAIIMPVRSPADELVGVVVGEAPASRAFGRLESASPGYEGATGLVDRQGLFLYHSARKREWARLLAVRQNETLRSDYPDSIADIVLSGAIGEMRTDRGELVSFRPLHLGEGVGEGLTMYRAVPMRRLQEPVAEFLRRVAVVGAVAVALVLLVAVVAANQFTDPIISMRGATRRIADGGSPSLVPVETNDELEDLAMDLAGMAATISAQRQELQALLSEQGRVLERTRASLADVVDHSADAIIMMDADGRVTGWNQGATRLFGYEAAESVGQDLEALIGRRGPGIERELAFFTRELAVHGEVVNYDTERRARDGTVVPVSLTLTRVRAPDGAVAGSSCILRDNRQHALLDEQLRRSERLASVSVLAAGLAHEINNPLAILGNRIEVMQRELDRGGNPETLRTDLTVLATHVSRLASVTGSLLRFAREDDGNESQLDVGQVAERVASLLERTIVQRRLRLDVQVADGLPPIRANERAIETVVLNLLINAADATPPGGTVSLRVDRVPDEGAVRLSVSDTGPGVPPELRDRIFEPFFTTKPVGKGTGLGLTVCRTIVERHGGHLVLGPADGGGARFDVTLYQEPARFTWMSHAS